MDKKRKHAKRQEGEDSELQIKFVHRKKSKALPNGYVCSACGAQGEHAIYDCPQKLPKKPKKESSVLFEVEESNEEEKGQRREKGVSRKFTLLLSGLPFTTTKKSLITLIQDEVKEEIPPKNINLVMFDDNPKRCRGLAFVKLETKAGYDRLLLLNGKTYLNEK